MGAARSARLPEESHLGISHGQARLADFAHWSSTVAWLRDAIMVTDERCDDGERDLGSDLERLLIIAYARLLVLSEQADSWRAALITAVGDCELRLVEMPVSERADSCPLWVELWDRKVGRIIDSAGCRDLDEVLAATERFLAAAQRRHARKAVPRRFFDPITGKVVEIPPATPAISPDDPASKPDSEGDA
jgi:hypothetical protein